ncbi:MAG: 3-keto-5-aminohexanoate cleavage protein [Dehalococcoidia bacterium]|nr:MAG: 3-keto-5-aminohexanoate cleavage protein [Dehalococcoidia bacterium]
MIKTDKLIICVAPCGSFLGKGANPNIPIQPDEIAEEVHRSWNEGASLAHIHARSPTGKATTNPEIFREINQRIRDKGCDIIVEFSTSPGRKPKANVNDGFNVLEAGPEMASVDIGVVVFMHEGEERIIPWTRSFDEKITKAMLEKRIKPEFEIWGPGGMVELNYLIKNIPLTKPYWIDFVLDVQRTVQSATPFTPKNLMHLVEQLPPDSMFMTMGVANAETPAVVQSILLGGHARVGFEDNLYYSRGVLAKSNAELVARIARIGSDLGRTIATPDEARLLLGIPKPCR